MLHQLLHAACTDLHCIGHHACLQAYVSPKEYVSHAHELHRAADELGCLVPLVWVSNSTNRNIFKGLELTHSSGRLDSWMLSDICRDDRAEDLLRRVAGAARPSMLGNALQPAPLPTKPPELRDYQMDRLAELAAARAAGKKRGVAMLATGSGKVLCCANRREEHVEGVGRGGNTDLSPFPHVCRQSWPLRTFCVRRQKILVAQERCPRSAWHRASTWWYRMPASGAAGSGGAHRAPAAATAAAAQQGPAPATPAAVVSAE